MGFEFRIVKVNPALAIKICTDYPPRVVLQNVEYHETTEPFYSENIPICDFPDFIGNMIVNNKDILPLVHPDELCFDWIMTSETLTKLHGLLHNSLRLIDKIVDGKNDIVIWKTIHAMLKVDADYPLQRWSIEELYALFDRAIKEYGENEKYIVKFSIW